MNVILVGSGKLASELEDAIKLSGEYSICRWRDRPATLKNAVVVHAGSGRALADVAEVCAAMRAPLVELATGTDIDRISGPFPIVVCPNVNILMLKFMNMLDKSARLFAPYQVTVTESHQASKSSVPGTAVQIAASFGLDASDVQSVRDPRRQQVELGISQAHLGRHAFHDVRIADGSCSISLQARVEGASPYAAGLLAILRAVGRQHLENRRYDIGEFIDLG